MSDLGVNVAILTDHDLVYQGLSSIVSNGGMRVCTLQGPATERTTVDVALYDVNRLPRRGLAELDRLLHDRVAVLMVVDDVRLDARPTALLARPVGWVEMSMEAPEINGAVMSAATGRPSPASPASTDHDLSAREAQIITLIASGLTNQEIGASLFLSINTVKTYIRTTYRKLDISWRSEAVLWAARHGYWGSVAEPAAAEICAGEVLVRSA